MEILGGWKKGKKLPGWFESRKKEKERWKSWKKRPREQETDRVCRRTKEKPRSAQAI